MRKVILITFILVLLGFLVSQEEVKEKVEVTWWVLPLFAVDSNENSIGDLGKEDIELWMDDREIEDFMIYRRDFSVAEGVRERQKKEQAVVKKPFIEKDKIIFLLFDTVLTSAESIRRAKQIAWDIIATSTENNRFVLFTIDLESGLDYQAGPLNDKEKVLKIIEEKVKERLNRRALTPGENVTQMISMMQGRSGGAMARYTQRELEFFEESAGKYLKARSMPFFRSFTAFYYNINSLKDNKFIYLFTEGVSRYQQSLERGNIYYLYMKWVAEYLGRSGSVLFVVNPARTEKAMSSSKLSGKNTLEYLARESGGKYIQGTKESICERINNFHRAYYEIAFADPGDLKGNIHRIKVKSKRRGVKIHTLNMVERSKNYAKMKKIEKEVLVLNLISQNPLYETNIESKGVKVLKISRRKGKVTYKIKIPDDYLDKEIDLYKVLIDKKTSETKIEKEKLTLSKNKYNVSFTAGEQIETNFVLVNAAAGSALIEGPGIYGEILEITRKGKALSDDPVYRKVMEKYLKGAAGYCSELKEAAFRCFCKEKIEEVYSGFSTRMRPNYRQNKLANFGGDDSGDISAYSSWVTEEEAISKVFRTTRSKKKFRTYVYDYQLISRGGNVEEQRKLLSKSFSDEKVKDDKISNLVFSFLTEKAVFGPVTLLAGDRQEQFVFRLLEYEKHKGRRFAVIEVVPKKEKGTSFAYGRVWVDTENHSVRKIQLDPRSIQGYEALLQWARQLRARLALDCEIEYNTIRGGIRFPTRIVISETYKGGPFIIKYRGGKGWERVRTIITYKDYQFFDVDASVEKTKIDQD